MAKPKRWPRKRRRRKFRQHCSTCGEPMAPTTRAYCTKACEYGRHAQTHDDMSEDRAERYLELARLREDAPAYLRREIDEQLAVIQAEQEADVMPEKHETVAGLLRKEAEFWVSPIQREVDRFENSMRSCLKAAIRLGKQLLEAKDELPHGEFGRLFRDHDRAVVGALAFRSNWANRLMRIAESPVLTNPQHAADLPADVEAVYLLTRLDDDQIDEGLAVGQIHAGMTRDDVRALLPASDEAEPRDDVVAEKVMRRVGNALKGLEPATLLEVCDRARAMLRAAEREAREALRDVHRDAQPAGSAGADARATTPGGDHD